MSRVGPTCHLRFDSSDRDGRWSRCAGAMRMLLRCDWPYETAVLRDASGTVLRQWSGPLEAMQWLSGEGRTHEWLGWISYDLGRWFEEIPTIARNDLNLPLFVFSTHQALSPRPDPQVRIIAGHADPDLKVGRGLRSTFTREKYERAVQRAIDYIGAGDVFQVNLSQRFTLPLSIPLENVYEYLLAHAPATYGALLQYEDFSLICNSPELFLQVTPHRRIITRPIKGTRPRSPGMEAELLHSVKDQAELNMIVDLERNDLGRVCETGSVRVIEPRTIEAHPTVYHGVATIEGTLRRDVSFLDLLRATFPGGSITGAPKIRAMQIIEELEPVRRGPYCGAIGYLAADGTIELNIAIRTMLAKDGFIHIPVGGGIVADSVPSEEYEETLVKARAMFAAVRVEDGEMSDER